MYNVIFSKKAGKEFDKLEKIIQKRLVSVIKRIRIRPEAFVRKLVGGPYYRLRVGEYRVILDIRKGELIILVISIGHRRNIYKSL
ncbi:MAG: type II toxin-antitoxin system RelE/ParE family toxin [Candidatus Aenigmarchaeota archaeon]|nr:type II toxin-antitoxin system RelE/ParE family toxin [Candidatus Aenigmarchaeota archaeon]